MIAPMAWEGQDCDNRRAMAPPASDVPGYPHDLEREITLKDGTRVRVRPIRADDQSGLIELYDRLSQRSAYQRFFNLMRRLPPDWAKILATVDYRRRLALVAEHEGPHGLELIGVGRYEPTGRQDTAEIAFVVQDGWQNRGLGTILFRGVLDAAQARGISRFVAYVLADNTRMLDLIQRFTDVRHRTIEQGVVEIVFTPRAQRAKEVTEGSRTV
jgi:RimJ/RimL family protein N-acetyltransferase